MENNKNEGIAETIEEYIKHPGKLFREYEGFISLQVCKLSQKVSLDIVDRRDKGRLSNPKSDLIEEAKSEIYILICDKIHELREYDVRYSLATFIRCRYIIPAFYKVCREYKTDKDIDPYIELEPQIGSNTDNDTDDDITNQKDIYQAQRKRDENLKFVYAVARFIEEFRSNLTDWKDILILESVMMKIKDEKDRQLLADTAGYTLNTFNVKRTHIKQECKKYCLKRLEEEEYI